jgi:hypothetical protein
MGGPAPAEVKRMLKNRKKLTSQSKTRLKERKGMLEKTDRQLKSVVQRYFSSDTKSNNLKSKEL